MSNVRQDIAQIDGDGAEPDRPRRPDRPGLRLPLGGGLGRRCSRSSAPTAPCSRTTSPRTTISRSATRSRCAPPATSAKDFVVRGIYEGSPFYPLLGSASVSQEAFDDALRTAAQPLHADQCRGRRDGREAGVESALEGFPDTRTQTREEWIDKEDQEIQQFLLLLYVLLALSVIISLFGMVNTLALVRLRAHARAGDAARGGDDPATDAADDPARERDHRADRRGARAAARDLPGGARDARARPVRPPLRSCRSGS